VLFAAEILWCLLVTTPREECRHAGENSKQRMELSIWQFCWAEISSYFSLVLCLAQQNVDQQQRFLALVMMLADLLHDVAEW